ncbi:hypothetical protein [Portibacter marinus]|uniref:hypothetical protein n=1 Tax=Portibacter marinus TaxID=2898660 RepID=UPI001F1FBBF9|nr:hypothetical protein [Portibacter marinus]
MKISIFFLMIMCMASCVSVKSGDASENKKDRMSQIRGNVMYNPDPNIELSNHLRKFSGVRVSGSGEDAQIFIRTQLKNASTVLFVVNGQFSDYKSAFTLASNSYIKTIEVLKDPIDTALFGYKGAHGVIKIVTN